MLKWISSVSFTFETWLRENVKLHAHRRLACISIGQHFFREPCLLTLLGHIMSLSWKHSSFLLRPCEYDRTWYHIKWHYYRNKNNYCSQGWKQTQLNFGVLTFQPVRAETCGQFGGICSCLQVPWTQCIAQSRMWAWCVPWSRENWSVGFLLSSNPDVWKNPSLEMLSSWYMVLKWHYYNPVFHELPWHPQNCALEKWNSGIASLSWEQIYCIMRREVQPSPHRLSQWEWLGLVQEFGGRACPPTSEGAGWLAG